MVFRVGRHLFAAFAVCVGAAACFLTASLDNLQHGDGVLDSGLPGDANVGECGLVPLGPSIAIGSIALVQTHGAAALAGDAGSASFLNPVAAGDMLLGCADWSPAGPTLQSVSDSNGPWSFVPSSAASNGTNRAAQCYYRANANSGGSSVTFTFSQSPGGFDLTLAEYAGVSTLEYATVATGNDGTPRVGPLRTQGFPDLVIGFWSARTSPFNASAGNGLSAEYPTNPTNEFLLEGAVLTCASTMTYVEFQLSGDGGDGGGNDWVAVAAAFTHQ